MLFTIKDSVGLRPRILIILIAISIIATIITLYLPSLIFYIYKDSSCKPSFENVINLIDVIISGLAFAGLIVTIIIQMNELELTRNELKNSVAAQNASQIALNKQLNQMDNSNKINALSSYIGSKNYSDSTDKKEIANAILQNITEKLFSDEDYSECLVPKFIKSDETLYNSIYFTCVGPSVRIEEIICDKSKIIFNIYSLYEGGKSLITNSSIGELKTIERGNYYRIHIIHASSNDPVQVVLKVKGLVVQRTYKVTITLDPQNLNKIDSVFGVQPT